MKKGGFSVYKMHLLYENMIKITSLDPVPFVFSRINATHSDRSYPKDMHKNHAVAYHHPRGICGVGPCVSRCFLFKQKRINLLTQKKLRIWKGLVDGLNGVDRTHPSWKGSMNSWLQAHDLRKDEREPLAILNSKAELIC
jgi:hypothetical protein